MLAADATGYIANDLDLKYTIADRFVALWFASNVVVAPSFVTALAIWTRGFHHVPKIGLQACSLTESYGFDHKWWRVAIVKRYSLHWALVSR